MKTSCIQHRENSPLVILHADYLDICDNDIAAAIILRIIEHWTNVKLNQQKQIDKENEIRKANGEPLLEYNLWVYKTRDDFIEDSLGLLKMHDVKRGLKLLFDKGFIERRRNPRYGWDRTPQYSLNIDNIHAHIHTHIGHRRPVERSQVTDQSATGDRTIPETTTEITKEPRVEKTSNSENALIVPPIKPVEQSFLDRDYDHNLPERADLSTGKRRSAEEAKASVRQTALRALAGGSAAADFPEDVRDLILKFGELFQIKLPNKNMKTRYAYWIKSARELKEVIGADIDPIYALEEYHKEYKLKGKADQFTVISPKSIVNTMAGFIPRMLSKPESNSRVWDDLEKLINEGKEHDG